MALRGSLAYNEAMQTAEYWHSDHKARAQCDLCPHRCVIREGQAGRCRVRGVREGELRALSYGAVASAQMDPIEKKPLYHFYPGRPIFSVGGWGCNLSCSFCQNWTLSQADPAAGRRYTPAELVDAAADSIGIAYTYNEPCIAFEFVRDAATLARERGLQNVLVTNGHLNPEPAAELLPLVDALNIDIKSMDAAFYRDHCGGDRDAVLAFAEQAHAAGCHVELTQLVIPTLNDGADQFRRLVEWVGTRLDVAVPLHLSAYRPMYKMDIPATPTRTLERAWQLCAQTLDYVYLGNVSSRMGTNTECPGCEAVLIKRSGFQARVVGIRDGCCSHCGRVADVVSS
jgi:pyruvate formate lyase activating enzyme